ncbi:MAG TPA: hypothetical protein VHK27_00120 [Gammaproteobacteria bacterium]|nr:hypothetical protein [Gammaproteobacteria bacterium]
MKRKVSSKKAPALRKRTKIRTSLLELMQELTKLTHDDNLVIGTMKSIFGSYKVRLAGAPVALRLEDARSTPKIFRKRNGANTLRFA